MATYNLRKRLVYTEIKHDNHSLFAILELILIFLTDPGNFLLILQAFLLAHN